MRKRIGKELRRVWDAADLKAAEAELARLVESYRDKAAKLALWLEDAIPEGLTVFSLPERHRKRMRTSNPIERSIQQEIKRRTVKVRVFPNEASLERLVTAILVEIDEKWATADKPYISWKAEDDLISKELRRPPPTSGRAAQSSTWLCRLRHCSSR